jgi:hypothetical protein
VDVFKDYTMIGSPDIDKHIRKIISPILRNNGFEKVKTRNNWAYRNKCIWIFNIRAAGNYFSYVTGFPPMSLTAWLGIVYTFIPTPPKIKRDKDGFMLPPEYAGHMRYTLKNHDWDLQIRSGLENEAERKRNDIWWIEPNGSNVEIMVHDLAESLKMTGIPWFLEMSDLENALRITETERDCYNKFRLAMYFAKEIGKEEEFNSYKHRFEEEAKCRDLPVW